MGKLTFIAVSLTVLLTVGTPAQASVRHLSVDATTSSVSAQSAVLNWTANLPSNASLSYGSGQDLALYASSGLEAERGGSLPLAGLAPATSYSYQLRVRSGRQQLVKTGVFTTDPYPASTSSSVDSGAVVLNGQSFFPVISWVQCPSDFAREIDLGINLFAGVCPDASQEQAQAAATGRAYTLAPSGNSANGWQLGWFLSDEADGNGITPAQLPDLPASGVQMMTVTDHFSSLSAPVSESVGKAIYPGYFAHANLVGFDTYPLAHGCTRPNNALANVWQMQRDLVQLTAGKATFQWIETSPIEGFCSGSNPPVNGPAVAAESWLAIAGGADGLAYFTHSWYRGYWDMCDISPDVGQAITQTTQTIRALQPALLSASRFDLAEPASSPVRAGGRSYQGASYVIAVNSSFQPTTGVLGPPKGLARPGASWQVYGEGRAMQANRNGVIVDHFEPLAVHIYVLAPAS